MAVVRMFCFWFSVRLGSILIGIFTLIQAAVWSTLCVLWMEEPEDNLIIFNEFLDELSITEGLLRDIGEGLQSYIMYVAAFLTALMLSSVLLVLASIQCKPRFMYPFLLFYFAYVALLTTIHVALMLSFKNAEYGLGSLILYSNLGGFLLLYLFYLWVCVFSFVQIIFELRAELEARNLVSTLQKNYKENISSAYHGMSYFKY